MKRMLLVLVFFAVGCAAIPFLKPEPVVTTTDIQASNSIDRESIKNNITKSIVMDMQADEFTKKRIDNFIATYVNCGGVIGLALDDQKNVDLLLNSISYEMGFNLAVKSDSRPRIEYDITGSAPKYSFMANLLWPSSATGQVVLSIEAKCTAQNMSYTISIPQYSILDALTPMGQRVAAITVDEVVLGQAIKRMATTDVTTATEELLKAELNKQLYSRYKEDTKSRALVFNSEKTYNVPLDVVISRVQRALQRYAYDKDNTLFSFKDSHYIHCENPNADITSPVVELRKEKGICSFSVDSSVTFFPESNGRAAAIFKVEYPVIKDSFDNDKVISESVAQKYLNDMVKTFDAALSEK